MMAVAVAVAQGVHFACRPGKEPALDIKPLASCAGCVKQMMLNYPGFSPCMYKL